ncbi:MAG TPA: thermostable hemolysin delta-VPH [Candidatus Onthoplasma faecipullorum]|nr:thermostable hemolysin delta-VPH [Candidatus Onthoplasma faecipullorum]
MPYYNYHAIAKRLINDNHLIAVTVFPEYKNIRPALVLYFDNHRPIPIRDYMWDEYLDKIRDKKIEIINEDNIPLK